MNSNAGYAVPWTVYAKDPSDTSKLTVESLYTFNGGFTKEIVPPEADVILIIIGFANNAS